MSCFLVISCNDDYVEGLAPQESQNITNNELFLNYGSDTKMLSYKGFSLPIPAGYPSDLMDYETEDFQNIALRQTKKEYLKVKHIKGSTLLEIIEDTYSKYPSFDRFEAEKFQKIFPTLTLKELNANSELIYDFIEKLMAYDISSAFSQLENASYTLVPASSKNARGYISSGTWLNSACTVAVVIAHPRLDISGLSDAVSDANSNASTYGTPTNNGGSNDFMDAVRHGIWGVYLGKHGTWRYSNPNNAENIILQLLNAHECGQSGLGTQMDYHNNNVALKYYRDNVQITGSWANRNTRIYASVGTIASVISGYSNVVVANQTDINNANDQTLVRIN